MATQALQATRVSSVSDLLGALIDNDGSASHTYPVSEELLSGQQATRNLADAVHYLCVLHGRHPGVVELAGERVAHPAARAWLAGAAEAFAFERTYVTRLTVAAGPLPSTPGQAECESAVMGQRHALEMLARSERSGCALGAAIALVMDWRAIRRVLDTASVRLGVPYQPGHLPDDQETRTVAMTVADTASVERALAFGAQQLLAQHRGLWTVLEARREARSHF